MSEQLWYTDHSNLVMLVRHMADYGYNADEVADAVEKPWHYQDEYLASRATHNAEVDAVRAQQRT